MIQLTPEFRFLKARPVKLNPFGGDPVDKDHASYRLLSAHFRGDLLSSSEQRIARQL